MTKKELIEHLENRLWLAEQDVASAEFGANKDCAIFKKQVISQVLDLVKCLE